MLSTGLVPPMRCRSLPFQEEVARCTTSPGAGARRGGAGDVTALAVAALEDKIVQRSVAALLNAIYEEDFLGFSHGFRPGRGTHDALDALCVGIHSRKVSWILDAESQEWLIRFVEHRIGDRRIIRLIRKWLKAGILEDGSGAVR